MSPGWTNFHTHSNFCDSVGDPEDFIKAALKQNVKVLGFSSHAPLPFATDWTMEPAHLPEYYARINHLKAEYRDKLSIYLGLEIDYIPGLTGPRAPQFVASGLDYCIGSVHYVGRNAPQGSYLIDGSAEEFARGIKQVYGGNAQQAVERYYELVREMAVKEPPDIIGHLDLIKINNLHERYFSEAESWYRAAVEATIRTIAQGRAIVEINTGGIARKKISTFYPSPWIIELCMAHRITITLSADAHKPEQLTGEFSRAAQMLHDIGYKEMAVLTPQGWRQYPFSAQGVELDF